MEFPIIVIVCVIIGLFFIGLAVVSIIQEQVENYKRFKQEKIVNSTKGYMLGVLRAEEYLYENGLSSTEEYIDKRIPVNFKAQVDAGFIDYVDYYKEHLHWG